VEAGRALELAYRFISRRERTEMELRSRLQRADLGADEIESAVAELIEFGYIDDARYARLFTQDRRALDAWGSDRIVRVLRERGVASELISAALSEGGDGERDPSFVVDHGGERDAPTEGDLGRAIALLSERFPAGPSSDRDHNRAFGVLARKGYESEVAADAVRAWVGRRSH